MVLLISTVHLWTISAETSSKCYGEKWGGSFTVEGFIIMIIIILLLLFFVDDNDDDIWWYFTRQTNSSKHMCNHTRVTP